MRLLFVAACLAVSLSACGGPPSPGDGGAGGGTATGGGEATGGGAASGGGGGSAVGGGGGATGGGGGTTSDAGSGGGAATGGGGGVVDDGGLVDDGGTGGGTADDAGTDPDAGLEPDAGNDAGVLTDAGVTPDAGNTSDAGPIGNPDGGTCGNGLPNAGETCDDGNVRDGDGCSSACVTDPGHFFEVEPNDDGMVAAQISDFSTANANGPFDAGALIVHAAINPLGDEDVFAFTNPGATPLTVAFETFSIQLGLGASCGDSTIDTVLYVRSAAGTRLASNDDRGVAPFADYCSSATYTLPPMTTVYVHVTGFDDNQVEPAYLLRVTVPVCGNSVIEAGEECDDGGAVAGNGCSATCQVEAGWSCAGTPSMCLQQESACSDGMDNDGDGQVDCADSNCAAGCTPFPACGTGQQLHVYNSITYNRAIPDNASSQGLLLPITPTIAGTVASVGVRLSALHPYDADIDMALRVSGLTSSVDLSSDNGGNGDDYTNTVFSDACTQAITAGAARAPFTGCYRPEGSLASFASQPAASTWSLYVSDDTFDDYGTLLSWSLLLCVGP